MEYIYIYITTYNILIKSTQRGEKIHQVYSACAPKCCNN